ncbi:O-antigen ligase family protein [Isoptericola aurantiacus]|uniref:O-antigen ligase family protein n=1 Tax=Isoptericola aurantiacus TaxID=3377839 RepID=UPI00383ACE7A
MRRLGRSAGLMLVAVAVAVVLVVLGAASVLDQQYAGLAAVAILACGLLFHDPMSLPVLAMPAVVIVERFGAGGIDLTISDIVLFGAFWIALVFAPRPFSRPMRSMLWLNALYQVATIFTVIANPYQANTVEWFHAWVLISGALVVGWAVGRSGHARLGMTLFLAACGVLAVSTLVQWAGQVAAGNFGAVYPTWPFGMHKNFVGDVVAFAAVVAYARPSWMGWTKRWALPMFWLCTAAVVASQARQAMVGLAVALVILVLRPEPGRRHSKLILLAVAVAGVYVLTLVNDQLESGNEFNSAYQRLTWYEQALSVWNQNPAFGVGLRWWTAGRTDYEFQPPNAELEVLTSAGAVGLAGFLVMFAGMFVVLWRMDRRYGSLALALVASRLVQAQFDLFWVAIQSSVPFLLAGVCLGVQARHAAGPPTGRDLQDGTEDEALEDRAGPSEAAAAAGRDDEPAAPSRDERRAAEVRR